MLPHRCRPIAERSRAALCRSIPGSQTSTLGEARHPLSGADSGNSQSLLPRTGSRPGKPGKPDIHSPERIPGTASLSFLAPVRVPRLLVDPRQRPRTAGTLQRSARECMRFQDSHFSPRRPIRRSHERPSRQRTTTPASLLPIFKSPNPRRTTRVITRLAHLRAEPPRRDSTTTRLAQSRLPPTGLSPPSGLSLNRDSRRSLTLEPTSSASQRCGCQRFSSTGGPFEPSAKVTHGF